MNRNLSILIEQCVVVASDRLKVDPVSVLTSRTKKHHPEHDARRLVWYHLHSQGMRYEVIGKAFKRSESVIRDGIRYAFLHLIDPHRMILSAMPFMPLSTNENTH